MFQIGRYLLLACKRPWRIQHDPMDCHASRYWVMPWDCDFNLHLTNSRYAALLDISRAYFMAQLGFLPLFLRKEWGIVVSSQSINYLREIKPFSRLTIESHVLHWDRKFCYHEDRFIVNGQLHAKAITRIVLLRNGRVASMGSLLRAIDEYYERPPRDYQSPPLTQQVTAKADLMSAIRDAARADSLSKN